jgi:2',3'-cyclic-nucleotide 2'-phosphodiesterase (5'-nucleotidase family)
MKKTLILLPLVALLLAGCNGDNNDGPLPPPIVVDPNNEQLSGQPEDGDIIKIIHMNDTHGAIEYLPDANEPGMARVAGYVNAKRAEADTDVVLVSSGDMFQGSLDSNINQGKLMIDIMKEMRFDSMSIGNHEFDWGPDVLSENAAYAMNLEEGDWAFPFLSGNILNPEGQYDFGYLSTTFNRGGARVSIIGSIDSGVYNSIDAAVVEGYSFVNAANMVIAEAERLREAGSDIIIYSTHDVDKRVDSRIALYVDAVFTGHNHHNSVATMEGADSKVVPII